MSRLSNSPRLRKGAIVAINPLVPIPNVIPFQYNPEKMTRSLKPRMSKKDGGKAEVQRIEHPPEETIKLDIKLDATDGLEVSDPTAVSMGVYPQLSALEMLIYPSTAAAIINGLLTAFGVIEIMPTMAPLTLFVWGPKRVLPVRIDDLSITETAFDERLNPIVATVGLSMRVLSYADYSVTDPGYYIFYAHQVVKEAMSLTNTVGAINNIF